MGFTKRALTVLAAAALTLSMMAGVSAKPGVAVLNGTQCEQGGAVNTHTATFGTWTYNGTTGYELTSGSNTHVLNVNISKVPAPDKKCAVTIAITQPLTNNIEEIPNSHFSLSPGGGSENVVPSTFQQDLGTVGYQLTLNSVPNAASTGTYNGTVTLTVSNGS